MVRLNHLSATADPIEMTIAGKNTIKITDVLIGEVWLGSGQSNMDFVVSGDMKKYPGKAQRFAGVLNEAQEIAAANYPQIREFRVPLKTGELPLDDVAGKWVVCTPETVPGFSAIGYFFARDLQKAIHQPVGFITSAFGASCAAGVGEQGCAGRGPASESNHGRLCDAGRRVQDRKAASDGPCSAPRPRRRARSAAAGVAARRIPLPTSTTPMFCGMR